MLWDLCSLIQSHDLWPGRCDRHTVICIKGVETSHRLVTIRVTSVTGDHMGLPPIAQWPISKQSGKTVIRTYLSELFATV